MRRKILKRIGVLLLSIIMVTIISFFVFTKPITINETDDIVEYNNKKYYRVKDENLIDELDGSSVFFATEKTFVRFNLFIPDQIRKTQNETLLLVSVFMHYEYFILDGYTVDDILNENAK